VISCWTLRPQLGQPVLVSAVAPQLEQGYVPKAVSPVAASYGQDAGDLSRMLATKGAPEWAPLHTRLIRKLVRQGV